MIEELKESNEWQPSFEAAHAGEIDGLVNKTQALPDFTVYSEAVFRASREKQTLKPWETGAE